MRQWEILFFARLIHNPPGRVLNPRFSAPGAAPRSGKALPVLEPVPAAQALKRIADQLTLTATDRSGDMGQMPVDLLFPDAQCLGKPSDILPAGFQQSDHFLPKGMRRCHPAPSMLAPTRPCSVRLYRWTRSSSLRLRASIGTGVFMKLPLPRLEMNAHPAVRDT